MGLAAGTLISTDRGLIPIEKVRIYGDRVLTRGGYRPLGESPSLSPAPVWLVVFSNGIRLVVTEAQSFLLSLNSPSLNPATPPPHSLPGPPRYLRYHPTSSPPGDYTPPWWSLFTPKPWETYLPALTVRRNTNLMGSYPDKRFWAYELREPQRKRKITGKQGKGKMSPAIRRGRYLPWAAFYPRQTKKFSFKKEACLLSQYHHLIPLPQDIPHCPEVYDTPITIEEFIPLGETAPVYTLELFAGAYREFYANGVLVGSSE